MKSVIIPLTILMFHSACHKDTSHYPEKANPYTSTHFLAHKTGGGSNNPYKENTLEAAIYGFAHLDGVEADIQKSRDGTLWLYHDEIIKTKDGKDKRIPGLTDNEIRDIITDCKLQLNTLEELLQWKQENNNKDYISLDIKSWLPTKYSNTQGYLIEVADAICLLSKKYKCGTFLLTECENAYCLKRIKEKDADIACFLCSYGDYDLGAYRALTQLAANLLITALFTNNLSCLI